MKQKYAYLGGGLLLAEVAVVCALATKDVPARESVAPRVLGAQVAAATTSRAAVQVRAQDPDGTITALTVRWSDGHESTATYPCESSDFGGQTVTHTITRTKRGDAVPKDVRATSRACFYDAPEQTGAWTPVTAG